MIREEKFNTDIFCVGLNPIPQCILQDTSFVGYVILKKNRTGMFTLNYLLLEELMKILISNQPLAVINISL